MWCVNHHQPRSRVHTRHVPITETIEAWIFLISILVAVWLVQTHIVGSIIVITGDMQELAALICGLFYTSILTTAPAVVGFAELSAYMPAWKIAIFGSIGAVAGEVLMFRFIRSPFIEHLVTIAFHPTS